MDASVAVCTKNTQIKAALLPTALVTVLNKEHKSKGLRALCDGGAQVNLVLARVVQKENWSSEHCTVRVGGVDNEILCNRKLDLKLLDSNDETVGHFEFLVVRDLSLGMLPKKQVNIDLPDEARQNLADRYFESPATIDMILGAGILARIIGTRNKLTKDGFLVQKSRLGWLVSGGAVATASVVGVATVVSVEDSLQPLLQRFWELEDLPTERVRTKDEEQCEEIYKINLKRDPDGRYEVAIPLKASITDLGSSREIAWSRYMGLERRFVKDPELGCKYREEINQLISAGYLVKATTPPKGPVYYIPHHAVTGKFRVVYDASCKTDKGVSLNQMQLIGEKLQDDLFKILLRFRKNQFAFTADIKKMYLQIKINQDQWDLQRIFWRDCETQEISEYWMTRVTFGMASAPHCAIRTMIQCALDNEIEYPVAAAIVKRDFYMDDCISGARSKEQVSNIYTQLQALLEKGGFELRKFRTNGLEVSKEADDFTSLREEEVTSVLGLGWNYASDSLSFRWRRPNLSSIKWTKAEISSHMGRLFDSQGFLGPIMITPKLILQSLHRAKIPWGASIPIEVQKKWVQWYEDLSAIQSF